MTFGTLKNMVTVLSRGGNVLPPEQELVLAALEMAYMEISDLTSPLKWLTLNKDRNILRQGPGSYWVAMPDLPVNDTDEIEIDSELGPAVARLMTSYISKDIQVQEYHRQKAVDIITKYGAKVRTFMESQYDAGEYDDVEKSAIQNGECYA